MADVPKAEDVCLRHSVQWHMYSASGFSRGVLKVTEPHWQLASMVCVCLCMRVVDMSDMCLWYPTSESGPIGLFRYRTGKTSSSGCYGDED